jgi:release factor glutamine methyltransferase
MPEPATVEALLHAAKLAPREARALLAHALGVPREALVAHPERTVDPGTAAAYHALCAQRAAGVPLAYLLGTQEFYGRPFRVTAAVLIPRPDTETLIEVALSLLERQPSPRVLDLGTGSGCIALTLACEVPRATVIATDVSAAALDVARDNAEQLGATVQFRAGDWYDAVADAAPFDLVTSNPPYVAAGDPHLDALKHEPALALSDGADGLRCLHLLIDCAAAHLAPGGWLLLEHGFDQAAAVAERLRTRGFAAVQSTRDLAGQRRVTRGRRPD